MKLCLSAAAALAVALVLSGTALATQPRHGTTLSLYERNAKPSRLARQGCSAARRGESGVVVLDFGKPAFGGRRRGGYGTLDFSGRFVSDHRITMGMLGWARGYAGCLPRQARTVVTLARGTSNYHPSVPSAEVAGKRWANAVLALARRLDRNRLGQHVRSAAADDAEPAWDRGFRQTRLFIDGFRRYADGRTLFDYGSLDGGVGSIWSARQMLYVVGANRSTAVLPEIYYPSLAREWAELAQVAHTWFHRRVRFAGVMTQGPCRRCGLRPLAAHRALVHALARVETGGTHVPTGGTNIVSGG